MRKPIRMIGVAVVGAISIMAMTSVGAADGNTRSGNTQVVAKVGAREITLSDIQIEAERLGLGVNDPGAAKYALQSIIDRTLLSDAAKQNKLSRQSEAIRKIAAAEEQVLADIYLSTASHPPEPTPTEIDAYISANADLFSKRKHYSFLVLTLPTETFDAEDLTPKFDETADFLALKRHLELSGAKFSLATLSRSAAAFPEPIRRQLAAYGVNDNIVIKGDDDTQILKITMEVAAPLDKREARKVARQILLQTAARDRSAALIANLRNQSRVEYLHAGLAPAE